MLRLMTTLTVTFTLVVVVAGAQEKAAQQTPDAQAIKLIVEAAQIRDQDPIEQGVARTKQLERAIALMDKAKTIAGKTKNEALRVLLPGQLATSHTAAAQDRDGTNRLLTAVESQSKAEHELNDAMLSLLNAAATQKKTAEQNVEKAQTTFDRATAELDAIQQHTAMAHHFFREYLDLMRKSKNKDLAPGSKEFNNVLVLQGHLLNAELKAKQRELELLEGPPVKS